jgi:hypothetical protein
VVTVIRCALPETPVMRPSDARESWTRRPIRPLALPEQAKPNVDLKNSRARGNATVSDVGEIEWDLGKDRGQWDADVYDVFGVRAKHVRPGGASVLALKHPDDVEALWRCRPSEFEWE